jgi:PKD repeat protein
MSRRTRQGRAFRARLLVIALGAALVVPIWPAGAEGEPDPACPEPDAVGFELGVGATPVCWTVDSAAHRVAVIDGAEGTVPPNHRDRMLALGTPRAANESQATGTTTVSRTFVSPYDDLRIALRAFSWETRGTDTVTLDLRDAGASIGQFAAPLSVTLTDGSVQTCSAMPCTLTMTGARNQRLDTGWRELVVTGVPTDRAVTLSYTLTTANGPGNPTWAYFDAASRPPVAQFELNDTGGLEYYEGSPIQLTDTSYDPDAGEAVVAWEWHISGPGLDEPLTSDLQSPSFIPPDDGAYDITLSVASADGLSDTVVTTVEVTNAPPLVDDLHVEALTGQPAPYRVGFIDAGWLDAHVATSPPGAFLEEEHVAALGTGTVSGVLPTGTSSAAVEVTDGDLTGIGTIHVSAVSATATRHEPDGTLATARAVTGPSSLLSWLQAPGDVDIVEIELPGTQGAQELVPGTEVLVDLSELPADYDLAVLVQAPSTQTAAYQLSPYQLSPYQLSAYQLSPYQLSPYQLSAYQLSPYQLSAYQLSAYQLSPYQLSAYQLSPYQLSAYQLSPLSVAASGELDGDGAGSTDMTPGELGIGDLLEPGVALGAFSANRGVDAEHAIVRVDQPGTRVFAVVTGFNGAHDAVNPYRLGIRTSVPLNEVAKRTDQELWQQQYAEFCSGDGMVTGPGRTMYDGGTSTLFVTQAERLEATEPGADWDEFWAGMSALADEVDGRILSVDATPDDYGHWDENPCDVDAANAVTDHVRDAIMAELVAHPSYEYVVIIGSDDVIPFRRVHIEATIADERGYVEGSFLRPGTPLFAALQAGATLSDDFYGDVVFTPFEGRELYAPDYAMGRLVETREQILAAANAYIDSGGSLDAETAAVAAHDFLLDGAAAIAGELSAGGLTVDKELVEDGWTADDLRCKWFGADDCTASDLVSPNSHWTHYAALSAFGYEENEILDAITSIEMAASNVGALVFTIGCHAGFSVPNGDAMDAPASFGVDPNLDVAEAMAIQQAVFVASTGWGLGDDAGMAGTELLMVDFARELMAAGATAGQALQRAKAAFLSGQATMDVYTEKSSVQTVLYGLPQYRVLGAEAASSFETMATAIGSTTIEVEFEKHATGAGTYWSADDGVQVTPGRPWQPKVVQQVSEDTHGVLIVGGEYTDEFGVAPKITRPTTEWERGRDGRVESCLTSWWPASLANVNDRPGDGRTLVVVPGQFRCDGGDGTTGTQRLFDDLELELLTSDSADATPPVVSSYDLRTVDGRLRVTLAVGDPSGIERIAVARLAGGNVTALEPFGPDDLAPHAGTYDFEVPDYEDGDDLLLQIADGAGNVTNLTAKGALIRGIAVDAEADGVYRPGESRTLTAAIANWDALAEPVTYLWDFGDGTTATGIVTDPDVDADGTATITIDHTYPADPWGERHVSLRILDADGGQGRDDLTLWKQCDPPGDVVLADGDLRICGWKVEPNLVTLRLGVGDAADRSTAWDLADGFISPTAQYRVEVDLDGKPGGTSANLRYADGSVTGPFPFTVVAHPNGRILDFRIPIDTMKAKGAILWRASVQLGLPGEKGAGQLDQMPDTNWFPVINLR